MVTVKLTENHRSNQHIVDAAQSIFASLERPQVLRGDGPAPFYAHAVTDRVRLDFVDLRPCVLVDLQWWDVPCICVDKCNHLVRDCTS